MFNALPALIKGKEAAIVPRCIASSLSKDKPTDPLVVLEPVCFIKLSKPSAYICNCCGCVATDVAPPKYNLPPTLPALFHKKFMFAVELIFISVAPVVSPTKSVAAKDSAPGGLVNM